MSKMTMVGVKFSNLTILILYLPKLYSLSGAKKFFYFFLEGRGKQPPGVVVCDVRGEGTMIYTPPHLKKEKCFLY